MRPAAENSKAAGQPMSRTSSSTAMPSAEARAELAPRGKLRVAFPVASTLYVVSDATTATLRGV